MSWRPANDPKPGHRFSCDAIETIIVPRTRDLGSFEVRFGPAADGWSFHLLRPDGTSRVLAWSWHGRATR
jgi:hypothetical protein